MLGDIAVKNAVTNIPPNPLFLLNKIITQKTVIFAHFGAN